MKKIFMLGAFLLGTISLYASEKDNVFEYTCPNGHEVAIVLADDEVITAEDEKVMRELAELLCRFA